jgi:hypothetical protein
LIREGLAHADGLRALPRKNESSHDRGQSRKSEFMGPRVRTSAARSQASRWTGALATRLGPFAKIAVRFRVFGTRRNIPIAAPRRSNHGTWRRINARERAAASFFLPNPFHGKAIMTACVKLNCIHPLIHACVYCTFWYRRINTLHQKLNYFLNKTALNCINQSLIGKL